MKKYRVRINGKIFDVVLEQIEETNESIKKEEKKEKEEVSEKASEGHIEVVAPIQGNVLDVLVKIGDKVKKGDVLLLIEAMKLENEVNALNDGEIVDVLVKKGDSVATNQLLVKIK